MGKVLQRKQEEKRQRRGTVSRLVNRYLYLLLLLSTIVTTVLSSVLAFLSSIASTDLVHGPSPQSRTPRLRTPVALKLNHGRMSLVRPGCLPPNGSAFRTAHHCDIQPTHRRTSTTQWNANASNLAASEILLNPFPYYFPDQNEPANLFPMPQCNGIKLEEATIDQLQEYMSQGKLTSVQLVMCYMQREFQTREYIKYVSQQSHPLRTPFY